MKQFCMVGEHSSSFVQHFAQGLKKEFVQRGYESLDTPIDNIAVIFHFLSKERIRPFRRKAQATFVVSILEEHGDELRSNVEILKKAYPYLVRSLSNHFIYISHHSSGTDVHFITPEQGCYQVKYDPNDDDDPFFYQVYERLEPLASSQLVIDNDFHSDMPENLWNGDQLTESLRASGEKLDRLNLLPAPFPLEAFVTPRDLRHIKKLYGIGGLSYGNLSCRRDEESFWMSASGVNKANMRVVGQDMLLIKGYDEAKNAMRISVPPNVEAKRASVDAIEHWMIYNEHPEVGAIIHVHAWIEGIPATEVNYPCGTIQLADNVAQLVRQAEDPSRAIIGLKNHGLTITGRSLEDIFERIDGKIIPQVPMS